MVANTRWVESRRISPVNVERINKLHVESGVILACLNKASTPEDITREFKDWTRVNYELQRLWKFKIDMFKHRGYVLPHCTCPRMDNDDMGYHMYFGGDCPLHTKEWRRGE
jgi:hypothetical protein